MWLIFTTIIKEKYHIGKAGWYRYYEYELCGEAAWDRHMAAGWSHVSHCTSLCPSSLSYKMGGITISTLGKNYVPFATISVSQTTK